MGRSTSDEVSDESCTRVEEHSVCGVRTALDLFDGVYVDFQDLSQVRRVGGQLPAYMLHPRIARLFV
jgi:hypothetical protein